MYFIILSVGASALLVSSVITIVILLRKHFKQWINTPLQILSISDVLFSIFTSGILLINYLGKIPHTTFDNENTTYCLNDSMWNEDIKIRKIELERDDADFNSIMNDNNLNIIPECNILNIIMKYGMLFFPFTNSFVSLLMFSIQCNLSVFNLKNECSKFLQFQEERYQIDGHINQSDPCNKTFKMRLNSIIKLMKSEKLSIVKQKLVQAFKCNEVKKDKRVTSILLFNQWIIPILIIGILYLSQYGNMNDNNDMENMQCFTESNFFFNECYNNVPSRSTTQNNTSSMYPTTLYKDYINNADLIKSSDANDTEVNEVISKVQSIVNAALNKTENILLAEYKSLTNIKNDTSSQNSSIILQNNINNYKNESMLFNYLIRNSSANMPTKDSFNKIQAVIEGNQNVVNEDTQYNSTSENHSVLSIIKVIVHKNDNISKIIQVYVANECYISIKFVKLHLLVFVFIIYFLPILFSSILHQHGKLNCQVILEKLKANNEILLTNINCMNEITYVDPGKATTSKENYKYVKEDFDESIENHKDYNNRNNSKQEHNEWHNIPLNREKLYLNIINQVRNTLKLFDIIKISLLYGILLWTPIFLELLLKVFILFNIPEWLMNITYLSATMFGVLRNVFNLKMIELQEINTNILKTNIVHPVA